MERKRRVLLVEDDALVRMFVMDLLEDHRFDVVEGWDGASARAALRDNPPFDLLATDVSLPGGGGAEIAAHARAAQPDLPVLFTTGHADFVWKEPVGAGPVAVLASPSTAPPSQPRYAAFCRADATPPSQENFHDVSLLPAINLLGCPAAAIFYVRRA